LATHYCLEDLLSSTGGVCAEVVSGDEADSSENVAGHAVEGVFLPGDLTKVDSEDEDFAVGGTDVIGARVVGGDSDADEDAVVNQIKVLHLLTPKDKLKLRHLLEEKFAGGSVEECTPQSNGDFIVDAGMLSGCKNSSHVCVPVASSSRGGSCLDFKLGTSDVERAKVKDREGHRHLTECTYRNGTAGVKCQGSQACGGLSSSFISTNIGCGSCNSYAACTGMTGKFFSPKYILSSVVLVLLNISYSPFNLESSSVGEGSCNAGNACHFDESLGERIDKPTTLFQFMYPLFLTTRNQITVLDNSCNEYYSCAYTSGSFDI
jgi:hypothetical protein